MSEQRAHSEIGARQLRRLGCALSIVATSACVAHEPGLLVEVVLALEAPSALAGTRITVVDLLACPGSERADHSHARTESLSLAPSDDSLWLTPRVGRYCDLRLQLEGDAIAPRQAVLPLTCRGERVTLALDEGSVAAPTTILVRATSIADDDTLASPQRALELLLRSTLVSTCE